MDWHSYVSLSKAATELESRLQPTVIEHSVLRSTANTNIEQKTINLDSSQSALKCALSYAYELKNFENRDNYERLNTQAKQQQITKSEYIIGIIKLEAQAILFRCKVFSELGLLKDELPFRKEYMDIYDYAQSLSEEEAIDAFAGYILDHGIVRREYSTKRYYADCYDFYAKPQRPWPSFYDSPQSKEVFLTDYISPDDPTPYKP